MADELRSRLTHRPFFHCTHLGAIGAYHPPNCGKTAIVDGFATTDDMRRLRFFCLAIELPANRLAKGEPRMGAEFRSVQTRMWREDEWFQDLDTDARLLFIYLFTNPSASISGIYRLPLRTMAFESGLPVQRVQQLLNQFSEHDKAHYADGIVWVVKMRENQLPGRISAQVETRLAKDIASIPDCELKRRYLIAYRYPIDTLSILRATETDTDTVTDTVTDTDTETETTTETTTAAGAGGGSDSALAAVYACWSDNMPGTLTPILADTIADDVETYGADEVIRAVGIAVTANKRSLQYVQGILRRRAAGDEPQRNGTPPKQKQKTPAYYTDPFTGERVEVQIERRA